jgi:hypothetical protein
VATKPELYLQDGNAAVSVHQLMPRSFNLGDEVQATGRLGRHGNALSLESAEVKLLWVGSPMAPSSVSASQAAIGSVEPSLIQVKGFLRRREKAPDGTFILSLEDAGQNFEALMSGERASMLFDQLKPGSLLSVQGVCTSDSQFTHSRFPFAVMLRSTDDLAVIADPPWWNPGHAIAIGISIMVLLVAGQFLYGRIENWRMRM